MQLISADELMSGRGARGGRDQFSWDDVKADHHRTNYLGNSIKAQVGRHTRDVDWFKHSVINTAQQEAAQDEIRSIQATENANIAAMLGSSVPVVPPPTSSVVRSPPRLQLKSQFVDGAAAHVSADVNGDHNGADTLRELESLAATIIRRNERRLERRRRRHEERVRRRHSSSRSRSRSRSPSKSSVSSAASSASPSRRQRPGRSRHHSRHHPTRTRSPSPKRRRGD